MRLALAKNSYKENSQHELTNKTLKVAALVRVSTNKEEQKSSLENQRKLFTQMCSENGWELYDFYEEIESGTHSNRKGLNQLISDAKEQRFDLIIAKELSRLARNVPLAYKLKEVLNKHKVHLKTMDGAIDTLKDDQDKFGLYAWIYEQESQKTSNRIKRTFRTTAKEGQFNGSHPPYGFYVENKKLFIKHDETPNIIRRIFQEYIEGKGFDGIARGLYNDGIPTPAQISGKSNASDKWHGSAVKVILMNPHYTGALVQCRDTKPTVTDPRQLVSLSKFVIVQNTHEAIISLETFNTAQDLIISRQRIRPQQEAHLFTNTAFCADCGRGLHFKKNRKGYVCGNYNKHGIKACSEHFIRETQLAEIVLEDIRSITSKLNMDSIMDSITKKASNVSNNTKKRLTKVKKMIKDLNNEKVKLTKLLAKSNITIEDYRLTIEDIGSQLSNLVLEKYELEKANSEIQETTQSNITKLKKELNHYLEFNELTPEMLHRLVDRIEIKEDGSPRIFYRFSNELL
ncbi:recombinase family protein [Bacillus benzoevorans]|uniref:DNA invertase Pin-like site-specific DNA recombinase n=1 Tax=Bacillus benzoevorans TaxID=1456 RepID=A0A7X0LWT8_9BACI|nr:recombinase family protein [Bacillus benzoevorans]MBB6447073.1 DNA invertase Pin-like site-specific DNA recombinase [Bacillus benzoevorans]